MFSNPASPARVEAFAKKLGEIVAAGGGDPEGDDVTLVVENYKMVPRVTARTETGRDVMAMMSLAISDPHQADKRATRRPRQNAVSRAVGAMLAQFSDDAPSVLLPGKRKAKSLSIADVKALKATPPVRAQAPLFFQNKTIDTPVLRIGRVDETERVCARLLIDGKPEEIPIARDEVVASFHDAAAAYDESGTIYCVGVSLAYRETDGRVEVVPAHSLATKTVHALAPMPGFRFLTLARQHMRSITEENDR